MEPTLILLVLVILLALVFDFTNGFHDAGNAVATVIATKALSPRTAVLYGASMNFVGALIGTEVAATIGKGLVDQADIRLTVVLACLLSATSWNFFTWYRGLPTSSTHALIGSLIGATVFSSGAGFAHVHMDKLMEKIIWPMFGSPTVAFVFGFMIMTGLAWIFYRMSAPKVKKIFAKGQIFSCGMMALSHGHNDAQKSMGIMALAILMVYPQEHFEVPFWVMLSCALAMGAGTLSGGWRIIRTLGSKLIKIQPIHGFAADMTSSTIIMTASHFGIPVSTTQVVTGSIMGVGTTKRLGAVRWNMVGNIMSAWIFTIPATFILSGAIMTIITFFE